MDCVVRPLKRCTVLSQGLLSSASSIHVSLQNADLPCLHYRMLDNERYESKAVNDRLNDAKLKRGSRNSAKGAFQLIFWVKVDGVFVARMTNSEIRWGGGGREKGWKAREQRTTTNGHRQQVEVMATRQVGRTARREC